MSSSEEGRLRNQSALERHAFVGPKTWSVERVVQWLRTEGLAEFAPLFEGEKQAIPLALLPNR